MCVYYYIKFIFALSNFGVKLSGALVLTVFVVGSVLSCLRIDTKVINCVRFPYTSKLLDLTQTVCSLPQPWGHTWMRLFWRLTLSDLLDSVISILGFFSDELCFFFLTQKVDYYYWFLQVLEKISKPLEASF